MPELPEVETVRRGLEPRIVGRTIARAAIHEPRTVRRHEGGPDAFMGDVVGRRVDAVARRGKFLWLRLGGSERALMVHLGMSGQLRVSSPDGEATQAPRGEGPASDPLRHRRATLELDDGTSVDFIDQRIFGGLWTSPLVEAADGRIAGLGSPDALLPADASHIGRDVLDPALDVGAVADRIARSRSSIKALLLDQTIVSGIGNIYADEALWEARTCYDMPGSALPRRRVGRLIDAAGAVMTRALDAGGTSFDALYVDVNGHSGYFSRSLAAYGQAGKPCPRCGTPIVRERFAGRSSFYCRKCQRRR